MMKATTLSILFAMSACAHTEVGSQKAAFEDVSEDRLEAMDKQIESLSKRRDQLLGQPKADLAAAIEALKLQVAKAKEEVKKLEKSNENNWLELKASVDKELYNMDAAHGTALKVFIQ